MWGFVYISDFLALNRRHKPFLALLGGRSSYSYISNRRSGKPDKSYWASQGKPILPIVVERRSLVNLCRISM